MDRDIERYALEHGTPEPPLLAELYRETRERSPYPRMTSGWMQGNLLRLLCLLVNARRVLDIGTFTGYSAIAMATAMTADGILHTIDNDDETADIARAYIERAGLASRVILHHGDARRVIPALREEFDLVFIDAGKREYPAYYRLAMEKTRSGGLVVADDVLWDGKVLDPDTNDPRARAIQAFNDEARHDDRVDNILLPLRHGLMIARKK
ncbi:MAG: class I SAM-dependent methyltransferase [Odoribacteraceae bacterium]|jgi:predicted O-methyltransferase YrrM|nr:class I SAM-dependent methyltransferase [Odoribacteraceae bacterium]